MLTNKKHFKGPDQAGEHAKGETLVQVTGKKIKDVQLNRL